MSRIIKGGDLMLFMGGKSIAFATSHTIEISGETTETTSKDSGGKWATNEVGKLSWTASSENLYAMEGEGVDYDQLYDAMIARNPVTLIMAVDSSYLNKPDEVPDGGWSPLANKGYTGQAYITSLSQNAAKGDNATFSVTFTGSGALSKRASA